MRTRSVAIIDSGGANIASLQIALQRLDVASTLTSDKKEINAASHIILPGVGSAAAAMQRLRRDDLLGCIAGQEKPVLGICLGLQLLATISAEGNAACLDIIPAAVERLTAKPGLPVPNMGWCRVSQPSPHSLFSGIADQSYFYFVHSYAVMNCKYTIATARHDTDFAAALHFENFYAAQFHPERSAAAGARFLANFLETTT